MITDNENLPLESNWVFELPNTISHEFYIKQQQDKETALLKAKELLEKIKTLSFEENLNINYLSEISTELNTILHAYNFFIKEGEICTYEIPLEIALQKLDS